MQCFVLLILFGLIYCTYSLSSADCSNSIHNATPLTNYRNYLLCELMELNCKLDPHIKAENYSRFVIVLYNRRWQKAKDILEKFSSCYLEPLLIDINANLQIISTSIICEKPKTTIIFDLTNTIFQAQNESSACVHNILSSRIVSMCPNTIWITGTSNCRELITNQVIKFIQKDKDMTIAGQQLYSRENMQNKHLRVGTVQSLPFVSWQDTNGSISYSGIVFQAFNKMASDMKFSFEVIEPVDKTFGVFSNGSWNGLIKQLQDGETDIAVAPLTQTYLRSKAVDFTTTYYFEMVGIMFKLNAEGDKLWRMFSLFQINVWCSIFGIILLSTVLLHGLSRFSALPTESKFNDLFNCFWYNISSMSNQGGQIEPETWPVQTFLAMWWLFVFAVLAIYSGGLMAMLTSSHMTLPFKDLKGLSELVRQGKFKVCIRGGTAFHQAVLDNDEFEQVRTFLRNNPQYALQEEENCKKLILEFSDVAFLNEMTVMREFQKLNCMNTTLIILNEEFFPGYFSFAVQKNSTLNTVVSLALTESVDLGLIDSWIANYSEKPKFCKIYKPEDVVTAESNSLRLKELAGPFILFVVGVVVAIGRFAFEMIRKCLLEKGKRAKERALSLGDIILK